MSPRKPGPPANKDPNRRYPAEDAQRIADLAKYVEQPAQTLADGHAQLVTGRMRDELKLAHLFDTLRSAQAQLTIAQRLAAEYGMLHGWSQMRTATALGLPSRDAARSWYNNPLSYDDIPD
ncbi:MAG: hypothetical protein QM630_02215 [Microbacterium sp.]